MKAFQKILLLLFIVLFVTSCAQDKSVKIKLPESGICAHRGAMETHPENTITAFKEAIRLGAHMIEFDVRITKDKKLVIMHDKTVDRTTNGRGEVAEHTLDEIKNLDAGSWKSEEYAGEKVPTFRETLAMMPSNVWLNIHLKGNEELGKATAEVLISEGRIKQGVIACGNKAAKGVKSVNQNIMICNMERQGDREKYVEQTIKGNYQFIQLLKKRNDNNIKTDTKILKENSVKVNYYFGDTKEEVIELFNLGVNFVLTNKLDGMLEVADSIGVKRQNYKNEE